MEVCRCSDIGIAFESAITHLLRKLRILEIRKIQVRTAICKSDAEYLGHCAIMWSESALKRRDTY